MIEMPDDLRTKLEADASATLSSYYEPLKDRKRQELRDIELQHQQALENLRGWLRGENGNDGSPPISPPQDIPSFSGESSTTQNGSASLPTRRKMLLSVLPEFKDAPFRRRDVDLEIMERWPAVTPQTSAEFKNFTSSIAGLLTDLVEKGKLRAKKGEGQFDPTEYQVVENDEDTLLKSGP